MSSFRLIHVPGFVRWGIHVDIAPQWPWLVLQGLALWPIWTSMSQHLLDRADNPLGLLLLGSGAALTWRRRERLRPSPALGWLAGALAGTVMATLAHAWGWSDWANLIALLSLAAALQAFLPSGQSTGARPGHRDTAGIAGRSLPRVWIGKLFGNTFVNRVCHKAVFVVAMLTLLIWNVVSTL